MISISMQEALNTQINLEQYSAQLYLAMSAQCAAKSFKGFAHWLGAQAAEEAAHATKLIQFLIDRGGRLELRPIPAPPVEFGTVLELFEKTLEHEKVVTSKIHALFERARVEKDFASEIALAWYVSEQVEEEASISEIVDKLRAVGDHGGGIWYLDSKLGKRGKE